MEQLIFATNNANKLRELREIVGGRINILSLKDIGCDADIPEEGATIRDNAVGKAEWVCSRYHLPCFADDTGLETDALNGAPGVHSARYAPGDGHDSAANVALLLDNLRGVPAERRTARFRTVIALVRPDDVSPTGCGEPQCFEGVVEGHITDSPRGEGGFGYDPVFVPEDGPLTFAEMDADAKNAVSHRGRATRAFVASLTGR